MKITPRSLKWLGFTQLPGSARGDLYALNGFVIERIKGEFFADVSDPDRREHLLDSVESLADVVLRYGNHCSACGRKDGRASMRKDLLNALGIQRGLGNSLIAEDV